MTPYHPGEMCRRSQANVHGGHTVVTLPTESREMPVKSLSWILLGAIGLGPILLFNYWASFQPLSTLAYAGIVVALFGLANLASPFRFLGLRRRVIGALILAGGVLLAIAALSWPAATIHVAEHRTVLDEILPEYQFSERHSTRIHAAPAQVLQAVRQSTWADMRSLVTLLKIRGAVAREPYRDTGAFALDKRILDGFAASGYVVGGSEHEIVMAGGPDLRAKRPIQVRSLQEYADYRQPGAIKMAFDFNVEDAGGGWSRLTAETRLFALDHSARGLARYWRLILPGSGLLRREWLDGIKRRAEGRQ